MKKGEDVAGYAEVELGTVPSSRDVFSRIYSTVKLKYLYHACNISNKTHTLF